MRGRAEAIASSRRKAKKWYADAAPAKVKESAALRAAPRSRCRVAAHKRSQAVTSGHKRLTSGVYVR